MIYYPKGTFELTFTVCNIAYSGHMLPNVLQLHPTWQHKRARTDSAITVKQINESVIKSTLILHTSTYKQWRLCELNLGEWRVSKQQCISLGLWWVKSRFECRNCHLAMNYNWPAVEINEDMICCQTDQAKVETQKSEFLSTGNKWII